MVTILPKESDWSDAFQSIGKGVTQGYQGRADEMALQKAIGGLGDNPTPRQILDAVTGTKTYNPAAKQNAIGNYFKIAGLENEFAKAKQESNFKEKENEFKNKKLDYDLQIAQQKISQEKKKSEYLEKNQQIKQDELSNKKNTDIKKLSIEEGKLEETSRSNKAKEELNKQLINAKSQEKEKEFNYKTDLDNRKNKLQESKLEETRRSNLSKEGITTEKQNKLDMHNKEMQQIKQQELNNKTTINNKEFDIKNKTLDLHERKFEADKNLKNLEFDLRLEQAKGNQSNKQVELDIKNRQLEELQRKNKASEELKSLQLQKKELDNITKEKSKEKQDKQDAISLIDASELPEEEKEDLIRDVEAGRQSYRAIKNITKPKTGKEVNSPIDPTQLNTIKEVRDSPEFEKASAPKKYQMLTDAGVSRVNAESEVAIHAEEQKLSHEKQKEARKEEIRFHEESQKFDDTLEKEAKSAKSQLGAIADTRESIRSGKVRPTSWTNVFRSFGDIGNKIANAVINKEEAVLEASIPAFLEGRKELFGVRLSDADLKLLQNKLPDIGKSKEANEAILNLMEKYSKQSVLREKIGRDIKKQNNGIRPVGYQDKINERFEEMTSPVKVKNPESGKISSIPAYEVSAAIEAGGILVNE